MGFYVTTQTKGLNEDLVGFEMFESQIWEIQCDLTNVIEHGYGKLPV